MGKLYILRHGQASIFSDEYDQLSELGYRQSELTGDYFKKASINIDTIYYGPMKRHKQTMESFLENYGSVTEVIEMEGLREHQGYGVLKKTLPRLLTEDQEFLKLVNEEWNTKEEQIEHHLNVYSYFAQRWARGELDHMVGDDHQSWIEFLKVNQAAFKTILKNNEDRSSLVITSAGPSASIYGIATELDPVSTIVATMEVLNCAISYYTQNGHGVDMEFFNHVSHLPEDMRTLV